MKRNVYLFYSVTNYADTCRDPDDIGYSKFLVFTSLKALKGFVIPFINEQINERVNEPINDITFGANRIWKYSIFGSYCPTYFIIKMIPNQKYVSRNFLCHYGEIENV